MIILKIAFRNIFRRKKRSVLTGLMMAGGCALFALSFGMMDGTYGNVIDMFTRDHTGHIQIHANGYLDKPSIYKTFDNVDSIGSKIESVPYVESWSPRVYTPALAFAGTKTSGVQIVGIDPAREARTTRLKHKVKKGNYLSSTSLNEIVISDRLSRVLKVNLGDEVALISQGADGSIANGLFTVKGITGKKEGSSTTCYMNINSVQEFLSLGSKVHEIAVVLKNQALTLKSIGRIEKALKEASLDVEPWQVVESQFYTAMQADIKGNRWTMAILTIIIAVGVLTTVLMIILERTREFGVLKAIGSRPLQIFMLIVFETAFLSVLSIIIGTIAGIFANWWFSVYGITYSTPIEYGGFYFYKMTSEITLRSIVMPALVIFGTAVFVSVWPAIRAARIIPVKALRTG